MNMLLLFSECYIGYKYQVELLTKLTLYVILTTAYSKYLSELLTVYTMGLGSVVDVALASEAEGRGFDP